MCVYDVDWCRLLIRSKHGSSVNSKKLKNSSYCYSEPRTDATLRDDSQNESFKNETRWLLYRVSFTFRDRTIQRILLVPQFVVSAFLTAL